MGFYPRKPNAGQLLQTAVGAIHNKERFVSYYTVTPGTISATVVHAAIATLVGAQTNYTTGFPVTLDVPRNVTIKGNDSDITGNVVVYGTNINDDAISETIALNGSTEVVGNLAFKTVTKVDLPAYTADSAETISLGRGHKLGLPEKLATNTVLLAALNAVREATAPTVTVSTTAIESNTVLLNSVLDGNAVGIWYLV